MTATRYAGQGSDGAHVVCLRPWFVAGTETGPHVATDDSAATLDAIQFHEREGPAVAVLSSRTPVYVADLSGLHGGLLPAAADAASVSSALWLGLSVKRSGAWQSLGVISLYGEVPPFLRSLRRLVRS